MLIVKRENHLAVALESVLQFILIYRGWLIASHPLWTEPWDSIHETSHK